MKFNRNYTIGTVKRINRKHGRSGLDGIQKRILNTIEREDYDKFIYKKFVTNLKVVIDEHGVKFRGFPFFYSLGYVNVEYSEFIYREILKHANDMQRRQKIYINTESGKRNERNIVQSYIDHNSNILRKMNNQLKYYYEDKRKKL